MHLPLSSTCIYPYMYIISLSISLFNSSSLVVVNSSCTKNHLTPSTNVISSEERSESTTPTGQKRPRSSLPSTSQCPTSSVVKNKTHQSGQLFFAYYLYFLHIFLGLN